jgi:hypothetical protein
MTGVFKDAGPANFKQQSMVETNSTVSVYHCELYVAGTQIYLYDVFANLYVVGGVDQLSTFRTNLGGWTRPAVRMFQVDPTEEWVQMRSDEITVNGVRLQGASQADQNDGSLLILPSGRSASIRKGFGRDLMRAQRVVGTSSDPTAVVFALIAELVEIDGEKIVYEDLLAMDLNDVLALQSEVAGANFQGPPPAPSRPLFTSDSE